MAMKMNNLGSHIQQQSWATTSQPRDKNETTSNYVGYNNKNNLNYEYQHKHANSVPDDYHSQHETQGTFNNQFTEQRSQNKQFMSSQNHINTFAAPQQMNNMG
eukprot:393681_1